MGIPDGQWKPGDRGSKLHPVRGLTAFANIINSPEDYDYGVKADKFNPFFKFKGALLLQNRFGLLLFAFDSFAQCLFDALQFVNRIDSK